MNKIAGIAVALAEASTPKFKKYAAQIVKNSQALSARLRALDYKLVGHGSENHMVWVDLRNKGIEGWHAHVTLEGANIFGNKQTIPNDPRPPFYPSGYRLGTPAVTTRGMKEKEMTQIANFINEGIEIARKLNNDKIGSSDKATDQDGRRQFKVAMAKNKELKKLKAKVIKFARKFPVK